MLASLAPNTLKQYNVSLKLWWEYCGNHNLDRFSYNTNIILLFLNEQFQNGCSYGTLNSHRSALSLLLSREIGSDEQIKRLLKGAFRTKPPNPKYSHTWDPQLVLNHVSVWYPNVGLSFEKLSRKLVTLLAICTAHRVQTLAAIKLQNISFSENNVKIMISDIIKTSAPGRDQPLLFLPCFQENANICPACVLKDYIIVTKMWRTNDTDTLLLTHRPPHRAATTQTLSRWIKQTLRESGVDVDVFSAHSTRHASTSTARAAGVSTETIRKAAGWTSRSQTFARFYDRLIIDEAAFARSICLPSE